MSRKNYAKNPNTEKRQFWDSANANNFTYAQYYNRLTELAISMFQWNNLPETVDPRLLTECLMCMTFHLGAGRSRQMGISM